jgi:hypothetical protein
VGDVHVAQIVNNERWYRFKLDTKDGGHCHVRIWQVVGDN